MSERSGDLGKALRAGLRAHAPDLAMSLGLLLALCLVTGRIFRWAFDDELLVAQVAEHVHSTTEFVAFFLRGGDAHPPFAFTMFYILMRLGSPDWVLRAVSLAFTAFAVGAMHALALALIASRGSQPAGPATRMLAIVLFGTLPMAISIGDAIRWFPVFSGLVAAFVLLALVGRGWAAQIGAALALGLAACTNFLALFVAVPYAAFRYILQRRLPSGREAAFWAVVGVVSLPGWWSFVNTLHRGGGLNGFGGGLLRTAGETALGFLGGHALGIGDAWILLPLALITPFVFFFAIDRARPADPVHLLVLLFVVMPVMILAGFAEPRIYLYLSPAFGVLLLLFLHRLGLDAGRPAALCAAVLVLAPQLAAVAAVGASEHPFKRNTVIPFSQIVDAIAQNAEGRVRVISTDPVLVWSFNHENARPGLCASYFLDAPDCPSGPYDTIVVVHGHSNMSANARFMRAYRMRLDELLMGKKKVATLPFALDRDASLKTRFTGTPLGDYVLTVDIYR